MDQKLIGGFNLGVDTSSYETELPPGAARYIDNLLVGDEGMLSLRPGHEILLSGDFHSAYTTEQGSVYLCRGTVFGGFIDGEFKPIIDLGTDLVFYTEAFGRFYVSSTAGVFYMEGGQPPLYRAGLPKPGGFNAYPAGGGLPPGRYGVSISITTPLGEESPLSDPVFVDVEDGGIILRDIPIEVGLTLNIYTTTADGTKLLRSQSVDAVFPSIIVGELPSGAEGVLGLERFEYGGFISSFNGRLVVEQDGVLRFSRPLSPHHTSAGYDYIETDGPVTLLEEVSDGLLYGDSSGIWLLEGSDPSDAKKKKLSHVEAFARSAIDVSGMPFDDWVLEKGDPEILWVGANGYNVYLSSREVVAVTRNRVSLPENLSGMSFIVPYNGRKYVFSLIKSPHDTGDFPGFNS